MANKEQLELLLSDVDSWNAWRRANPDIEPDLRRAQLHEANLHGANLHGAHLNCASLTNADLSRADLGSADLSWANLRGAKLSSAKLRRADLGHVNLSIANLVKADLYRTNLGSADLSRADLRGADFNRAVLIDTNLEGADLTGCRIYGISVWNIQGTPANQSNLVITPDGEPTVTVGNLKVAQFIYLLLNNAEIRDVIDTITTKVVLILGRFTEERKPILEAIHDKLRKKDYLPVLFDFDKPGSQNFIETVATLAHMARFVIADVTRARLVLEELPHIVRNIDSVPVQPLLSKGSRREPLTLYNLRRNHRSVLDTYRYKDPDDLRAAFTDHILAPAETKAKELRT